MQEKNMRVEEFMTAPVVGIGLKATSNEAAQLMLANHISGLPVVLDDGTLVGVISEGDFLRRAETHTEGEKKPWWLSFFGNAGKQAEEFVRTHGRVVEEIMTRNPVTIRKDQSLSDAAALMGANNVKRLPVIEGKKVIGIISRSDLVRAVALTSPAPSAAISDDRAIEKAVEEEFSRQPWTGRGMIRVTVTAGVAELKGTIFDERVGTAARVVAENTPGVISVVNKLTWVEPNSGLVILPLQDRP